MSNPDHSTSEIQQMFQKVAQNYERTAGGAAHRLAHSLLARSPPITPSSRILDNACGTGAMTEIIMQSLSQRPLIFSSRVEEEKRESLPSITAVDYSANMLEVLKGKVSANGWENVKTAVMDAQALTMPDGTFSHSYMSLGIFCLPDAVKGAAHIYRTLAPGGVALLTTWKDWGYVPAMETAQAVLRPDLPPFKMPVSDVWREGAYMKKVLVEGGFEEAKVDVEEQEVWADAEDLKAFAGRCWEQFSLVGKGWKAEEKERWTEVVAEKLPEAKGFMWDGDWEGGAKIWMLANVAIARK